MDLRLFEYVRSLHWDINWESRNIDFFGSITLSRIEKFRDEQSISNVYGNVHDLNEKWDTISDFTLPALTILLSQTVCKYTP